MISFPLPNGEFFSDIPNPAAHSGDNDMADSLHLRSWEDEYRRRWDGSFEPTGRFGHATAEAARRVQREYGLLVTGRVDWDTWHKVFEGPMTRPVKAPPDLAGPSPDKPKTGEGGPGNPPAKKAGSRAKRKGAR